MEQESLEKAENKIILLYFIQKVRISVSNMQLTRLMLESHYMNYFILQQGLQELIANRLINTETRDNIDYYTISVEGEQMLDMFLNILTEGMKKNLDEIAEAIRPAFRHEASVIAEYTLVNEHEYEVYCSIVENDRPLIGIRLSVGSRDDARNICSNWQACAKEIYPQMIGVLLQKGDGGLTNNQ